MRETVGNPTHRSGPELAARGPLDTIFHPSSVAVIGATDKPGSVGRTILTNLLNESFGGAVHAVNSRRDHVLGVRAYPTVSAVPEPVDLAVIVTPAPTVPGLIEECGKAGVKSAIVISAGFKETGADGRALEARILEAAGQSGMRIIGPNCLGVMNPITGFNATFANSCALPGSVGFISQSGALCTAILDWSMNSRVGFSAFVSIGSMLDVDWGDLIYWLGDDPNTKSIVLYMESIGDPKAFLSAAREIALIKPIIVLKAGKTDLSARAAASHTGALAGSTDVLDAAFRRTGVLQVGDIESLFYMAEILGKQPRPLGPRLTILTNAGGPGVLASDSLLLGGGQLATLSESTLNALNEILPPHWSHNNPIDVLGDAAPDRYAASVELASKDPDSDGLLVVLTPQAMTDPTRTAEAVANLPSLKDKPILASWMGGPSVAPGRSILNESGIATFDYPDTAARVFNYMWRYAYDLQELYETPTLPADSELHTPNRAAVNKILNEARDAGQTLLPEIDSHELLAAYGIPVVPATLADSETAAAQIADKIGYPVVIKLHSKTITHKT
ncbi:MAG TPA: CoA-binding protein, partial [Candidatus Hydrogenedentes bacterium]|nr:CoA-binding protein [Candidatus Hydrogenedentota bacterium]